MINGTCLSALHTHFSCSFENKISFILIFFAPFRCAIFFPFPNLNKFPSERGRSERSRHEKHVYEIQNRSEETQKHFKLHSSRIRIWTSELFVAMTTMTTMDVMFIRGVYTEDWFRLQPTATDWPKDKIETALVDTALRWLGPCVVAHATCSARVVVCAELGSIYLVSFSTHSHTTQCCACCVVANFSIHTWRRTYRKPLGLI